MDSPRPLHGLTGGTDTSALNIIHCMHDSTATKRLMALPIVMSIAPWRAASRACRWQRLLSAIKYVVKPIRDENGLALRFRLTANIRSMATTMTRRQHCLRSVAERFEEN